MKNLFASLALAVAFAPAAASAQSLTALAPSSPVPAVATAPATAPATTAPAAAPSTVRPDIAGIHAKSDANAPLAVNSAAAEGLNQGEGVALMAVGGAGLIAGLLIGGNAGAAVAIGGVAVGLIGLYEYVR